MVSKMFVWVLSCGLGLIVMMPSRGAEDFDWSAFDLILKQQVKTVELYGIKANALPYETLSRDVNFLSIAKALESYDPTGLNQKQKLAFYINAYNYFAIKIVVDNQPVESIRDIGSFFSPVWKKTAGKINAEDISLDTIEHKILRPMREPRIHFAIVCASVSCPDLRRETFQAENLDKQLDDQVRRFLAHQKKGVAIQNQQLKLSKIFSWFEEDFAAGGGVLAFIEKYDVRFKHYDDFDSLDYDWRLNTLD